MAAISYVGVLMGIAVATPATQDAAGFGALTYTNIVGMISVGEVGDTSEDISVPYLSGRNAHVNGAKDGGSREFAYVYEKTDPGQVLLRANNNNNVDVSLRVTDPDGEVRYFFGRIADIMDNERTNSNYKGQKGQLRVNSNVITV